MALQTLQVLPPVVNSVPSPSMLPARTKTAAIYSIGQIRTLPCRATLTRQTPHKPPLFEKFVSSSPTLPGLQKHHIHHHYYKSPFPPHPRNISYPATAGETAQPLLSLEESHPGPPPDLVCSASTAHTHRSYPSLVNPFRRPSLNFGRATATAKTPQIPASFEKYPPLPSQKFQLRCHDFTTTATTPIIRKVPYKKLFGQYIYSW